MKLETGNSPEIISKAQAIRKAVFFVEQQIPIELDLDGLDEKSYHVLITDKNISIGTARLTVTENSHAIMARVAVMKSFRGSGVASQLVKSILSYAQNLNVDSIELHAHEYLRQFYESFGFEYIKDVEIVGRHQLIEMRLSKENIQIVCVTSSQCP